jgi:predicted O-methyltransferase YrrM
MLRTGSLSDRIAEYERSLPEHRAGTVDADVLQVLEDLAPRPLHWSMETGCGKSTILLSVLSDNHHVFAFDDRAEERSSVAYYSNCPTFRSDRTTLIPGPTQQTLPAFNFTQPVDLALLDGPHAYPYPELEYYYVYQRLRPGALLVIDDIHIPTIHRLFTFLDEDEMFRLAHIERTTAFFIRTTAPVFSPLGDGWEFQAFNIARFPVSLVPDPPITPAPPLEDLAPQMAALREQLAATEQELSWWKIAAEERRLKRRLARRLGDWPFLR